MQFQWYFKNLTNDNFGAINSSDDRFNISHVGLKSTLTVNKLKQSLVGGYRASTWNGIKTEKEFDFTVRALGEHL